jgi:hypothetical protein
MSGRLSNNPAIVVQYHFLTILPSMVRIFFIHIKPIVADLYLRHLPIFNSANCIFIKKI